MSNALTLRIPGTGAEFVVTPCRAGLAAIKGVLARLDPSAPLELHFTREHLLDLTSTTESSAWFHLTAPHTLQKKGT